MNHIRKIMLLTLMVTALQSPKAYSIIGDGGAGWAQIPYFIKILAENIKRYKQLKLMIDQAKNSDNYLRLINEGIDNSFGMLDSLPIKDEKILANIKSFKDSYNTINEVYGAVPKSKDAAMQMLHDQTVAESLRMINSFKEYSKKQEENSVKISIQGRAASPKGAARMQVEASSQILKSLTQLIRLNSQMLKLQSESIAMNNRAGKVSVGNFQKVNRDLGKSFKKFDSKMTLVRF